MKRCSLFLVIFFVFNALIPKESRAESLNGSTNGSVSNGNSIAEQDTSTSKSKQGIIQKSFPLSNIDPLDAETVKDENTKIIIDAKPPVESPMESFNTQENFQNVDNPKHAPINLNPKAEEKGIKAASESVANNPSNNSFANLSKVIDDNGNTVAHSYALHNPNWISSNPKVLLLTNNAGISVAYWLAYRQEIPTEYVEGGTPEVLAVVKLYKENTGLNTKPNWQTNNETVLAATYNDLSVAHLLSLNNPLWLTNSTKVLLQGAENQWTVAHVLAKNNPKWQSQNLPILAQPDANGWTVAHLLARYNNNWTTDNKQILNLKGPNNITVAHVLAMRHNGWLTNDPTILKLAEDNGWTVAHSLAKNNTNWDTTDPAILRLATIDGLTVAHLLARSHHNWLTKDKTILMLSMSNGRTVAHELARYNPRWETQDKDLLVLVDEEGFSLAHIFARKSRNWNTEDPTILSLKDRNGDSVAHYLAKRRYWNTTNPDILKLTNNSGVSVQDIINKR